VVSVSRRIVLMNKDSTIDLTLSQIENINICFRDKANIKIWLPSNDEQGSPIAMHISMTFYPLISAKLDVSATPWIEIIKPLSISEFSKSSLSGSELRWLEESSYGQLYQYILATDGGTIEFIAEEMAMDILETLPRR